MAETWFTSDHHFGHKNILTYESTARPFKDIKEMHDALIDAWNSVVKCGDIVYHLGDFAFGKHNIKIGSQLNGKKRLIMGNHDTYPTSDYLSCFDKCYGVKYWERCILTHIPIHPNSLGSRLLLNVHGHLHSNNVKYYNYSSAEIWRNPEENYPVIVEKFNDSNYFNVSVEQNNLYPINADVIRDRYRGLN